MYTLLKRNIVFLLVVTAVSACASGAAQSNPVFADVRDVDWVLTEVKSSSETIRINRQNLEQILDSAFTLRFDSERVSGVGAFNRYSGPYTTGEGRSLSIGTMVSTKMMSLIQPEGLTEDEFFDYLAKVTGWDLREGRLELTSSSGSGAVLVFTQP
jgi:heat shock protein HslJ